MYIPTYVCVRACDVRLAGCIALFSVSLSFSLGGSCEAGGRANLLVFAFAFRSTLGFCSLVVRTAELDGGCMRLSRDHM